MNSSRSSSLFVVVTTLAAVIVSSGCGFLGIRANPRIAKITSESESSRSTTSFDYDDDGRLVEVDRDFQILELEWDDGQLVEVTRKDPDGDSDDFARDLEYENGRLVELRGELADQGDDVTTIDYDKSGRIEKIEQDQLDGAAVSTALYEYDNAGRLTEIVNKSVFESFDEFGDETLIRGESRTEFEYEDGRLATMDVKSVFEDEDGVTSESGGTVTYEYNDDGLIEGAEFESDDDDNGESTVEIDYDDGDAVDIDVTPINSLFFVPSFDLRGTSFSSIDARMQAPRLAGVSW